MEQQEAMAALDKAIVKLGDMAEQDEDMALALEVVQAERAEAEYDGEFGGGAEPREPVRKEVAGISAFSIALLIIWIAEQLGVPMEMEVALAIAGIIGGVAAFLKSESYRLPGD